jgi:hypothetical protein
MSEQQPSSDTAPSFNGSRPWLSAVVDGDEVRELVARTEKEIRVLLRELEIAQNEADAAERRLAEHPSATRLEDLPMPLAVTVDAPLARPPSTGAGLAQARTVVDRRPAPSAPTLTGTFAGARGSRPTTNRVRRHHVARSAKTERRRSLASTMVTGWVWKAGLILVVAGLLVLKLG